MRFGGFSIDSDVTEEGALRLRLSGELDLATVADLWDVIETHGRSLGLEIDTTDLDFIDSTGLGALVRARNRFGQDNFTLVAGEATLKVLELSGTKEHLLATGG